MSHTEHSLGGAERAVFEAVGTADTPLSASVVAAATGLSVDEVMTAGDALITQGLVTDDPSGYGPTEQSRAVELSHARRTQLSAQLGTALSSENPALAGQLFIASGDPRQGFELLTDTALTSGALTASNYALAQSALDVSVGLDPSPERLGHLHMLVGRYLQSVGDSARANGSFASAALELKGNERIDALGFCAATADDRQRPQEAERWLAEAEYEALQHGEQQKYGSLLTLHARTLSRIGFPTEADTALAKGKALLTDASPIQHALAANNEAWILLDRGYARQAEAAFASLAFEATRSGNEVAAAFHTVYHARALYAAGKPDEAHALLDTVDAPTGVLSFLSQLALTEGAGWLEQWPLATARAEALLDVTMAEVPQWENVARFHLSRALLESGLAVDAKEQLAAALEACPPGTDGWRWRMRCRELSLAVDHANGQPWDQTAAENLTDELLVARWFDTAADLLIRRATAEQDPELARQAAGLAESVGNPTLSIRAAHAGDLWTTPQANGIAREAHALHASLSPDEQTEWSALAHVAAALGAEPPAPDEDHTSLVDELNETLQAIGLHGTDDLLTPAQRHQSGLVKRRAVVRQSRRWLGIAAAAIAVIGVAAATSYALRPPTTTTPTTLVAAPTTTISTTTTTTIAPTPEQTVLARPDDALTGKSPFGGDDARTGSVDATGVDLVGGYYWQFAAPDAVESTPVTYGRWVYFGASDNFVYALNQTTKETLWSMPTGGPVWSSPAIGQISLAGDTVAPSQGSPPILVIGSDDGFVWARYATESSASFLWKYHIGVPVKTTPIINGAHVIVAGGDGRVHGINGADGIEGWVYPAEGNFVAPFAVSPALSNGLVYAGDEDGIVHVIRAETGEPFCTFPSGSSIIHPPSIVDGVVYITTQSGLVYQLPEGECPSRTNARPIQGEGQDIPAFLVSNQKLFIAAGVAMYQYDLPGGESNALSYPADATISSPAVIANGIMYFGDSAGFLHAIDAETLEFIWKFHVGGIIRSAPAIRDGVVFVASATGVIYALGPDS